MSPMTSPLVIQILIVIELWLKSLAFPRTETSTYATPVTEVLG